jgi:hypothetical protein
VSAAEIFSISVKDCLLAGLVFFNFLAIQIWLQVPEESDFFQNVWITLDFLLGLSRGENSLQKKIDGMIATLTYKQNFVLKH